MFNKSRPYQEPDLFKDIMPNPGERKARLLEDPLTWHNGRVTSNGEISPMVTPQTVNNAL
jgi:hypothetical protein